jgi:AI-2 transport protein TqsA
MSPLTFEQSRLTTFSLVVLASFAIAVALHFTQLVMVPFVLAILLANLLGPGVDFLIERLRFPRALAVFVAILVALGILTLLGLLISVSARGMATSAPIYQARLEVAFADWRGLLDQMDFDLGQATLHDAVRQLPLSQWAGNAAGKVFGLVTSGLLVLVFLIFILTGRRTSAERVGLYGEMDAKIRRYVVTKILTSATTGILVTLILLAFGLQLAVVFGILAFFLNFIPNLGSVIATLLPLPVALIQYESMWPIIGVVAIPGAVQLTIGNGVEPVLMGRGLELHPLVILMGLLFWGLLWGVAGMFLAAPLTAILRLVLEKFDTTRPMAELMAGKMPLVLTAQSSVQTGTWNRQ